MGHVARLASSFLPNAAVLEMTYQCNHQCLFCSCPWFASNGSFDTKEELSTDAWKKVISLLCGNGVRQFAFTGGEPLLKQGIDEILRHAASCVTQPRTLGRDQSFSGPPKLVLLSNGRAMNADALALCAELKLHLSMSLPGLRSFEELTGGGDAQLVLKNFRAARAIGVKTVAAITVTKKNLAELHETMGEAILAGADTLVLNRFMPGGRGLEHAEELSLDKNDITTMLDTAEHVLSLSGCLGSMGTELPRCVFDSTKYRKLRVTTRCSAAVGFFVVGPSGFVRVCNHSPIRLYHVRALQKIKSHPYWKQFAQKEYLPENCRSCPEMGRCDGGCREAAHVWCGSPVAPDPLLQMHRSAREAKCDTMEPSSCGYR